MSKINPNKRRKIQNKRRDLIGSIKLVKSIEKLLKKKTLM